jgi:hypothetical protein
VSLSRRAFLQILGAVAASTTLEQVAALVPPAPPLPVAPVVDWSKWQTIACGISPAGVAEWHLNGQCVNSYPAIVQVISKIVSPGGGTRAKGLVFLGDWFQVNVRFTKLPDASKRRAPIECIAYDAEGHVRYAPLAKPLIGDGSLAGL